MLARRFLYIVAALIVLVIAAGITWNLGADRLLRVAFVPGTPWQAPAAAVPDYNAPGSWYARPEKTGEKAVAIFYVMPTTSLSRTSWNVAIDDPESADRQKMFFDDQARAFETVGDIWAPRYRQAVIGAFLAGAGDTNSARAVDFAWHDVSRAFDHFLAEIPADHPILLVGHSQGSLHLIRLLHERIAGTPVARRIVAAYLPGWPISIAHDLPTLGLPGCAQAEQTGCILSWQSFARPADPRHILALYDGVPGLDGASRKDSPMLCTSPSPRARCTPRGLLDIGAPPPGYVGYVLPGNNYHVFDYTLFRREITADAARRVAAFKP